jgi:hypothetical protein
LSETVYHVELRQFPHNMCRFNLSAQELRGILEPWSQERWIEFGERKWSPQQATLTVLEGPRIPFGQLTMGRGWRTAERAGREVTGELLAAVGRELAQAPRATVPAGAEAAGGAGAGGGAEAAGGAGAGGVGDEAPRTDALAADSLGLELLSRLGAERAPLRRVWDLAGERHPGSPPSATLALAERAVESLLGRGLIVLARGEEAAGDAGEARAMDEREIAQAIGAVGSWADGDVVGNVWMRRA